MYITPTELKDAFKEALREFEAEKKTEAAQALAKALHIAGVAKRTLG